MSGTLIFPIDEVTRVIAATRSSMEHRVSYEELYDTQMYVDGVVKVDENGGVDEKNIDPAKRIPKLWLIKDQGVYLMSNRKLDKDDAPEVTYAKGIAPSDEDFYAKARDIMGGDDCVIALHLDAFEEYIRLGANQIVIDVTPESIEINATYPAKKKAPR
jgi:hypothetical protein